MQPQRLILAASLLLLAGCKSDSTNPAVLTGSLDFTYSGGISGTFTVSGQFPTSTTSQETTPWAAGEVVSGTTSVVAAMPRNATSHDFFLMDLPRTTVGSSTVVSGCTVNCADVFIVFGNANGTGSGFLQSCFLLTGTLSITEISATRVKGTFSGTGSCVGPTGTTTTFTITGGTFDVALVPGVA